MSTKPKILYSVVASHETPLVEAHLHSPAEKSTKKYVKACRKILKKIARNELRRPDGMATLLSGSYAYNYIHGSDVDKSIESLIFLCVTEALPYAATPTQTREAAFHVLCKNRREFLEQFSGDLQTLCNATRDPENASNDGSSLMMIDSNMRTYLSRFSAAMRDQMANNALETYDGSSGASPKPDLYSGGSDKPTDDEKQFTINTNNNTSTSTTTTDLRQPAPRSLPRMYQNGSRVDEIIRGIESVKDNVHHNLEMVMGRGEDLALLHDKSQNAVSQSSIFNRNSRQLRYRYCKDLYRQRCVIALVLIFVLYLLSAMICGWSWSHCGR